MSSGLPEISEMLLIELV